MLRTDVLFHFAIGLTAPRARLLAQVGLIGLSLSACGDPSRALAQDVLSRTIPPGDPVPSLSVPVRSAQSLQFTWAFESRLNPIDYADWLTIHLSDFRVVERNGSNVHLARHVGGDAYRLEVTLQPDSRVTRVHVQLIASPD